MAARSAATDPRRSRVVEPRGRRCAAGRATGRDPVRPLRCAPAAGPARHSRCRGARPRGVPAQRGRDGRARRPAALHDRRRPGPGSLRPVEGDLGPDPGPLRRGFRHAEPAGDLPGASGALPPGESASADAVLPGDATGSGRRRAEHRRGSPRRGAQPGHPFRDGVRPGLRRLAAGLPAPGGARPHRPRRAGVDAGAGPVRAGGCDPAPGRLDLDGRAGAPARLPAGCDRSAGVCPPGHGQRGE